MRKLKVFIEINGAQTFVGTISGNSAQDACFAYAEEYIKAERPPISISLPVSDRPYGADKTRNFFEGLLPEGFAKRSVAEWIHVSEDDYLTILEVLGQECLGAIRVLGDTKTHGKYEELPVDDVRALAREGVSKSTELVTSAHLSLTGASGKVGLYYDRNNCKWYKPIGDAPSTHIVKQSHVRYADIVTNEQLVLTAAAKLGIIVPESFIVNTGAARDGEVLLATKRYDRLLQDGSDIKGERIRPMRLHQEDFAQALGIPSYDKYERGNSCYLPMLFDLVRNYTANPLEDELRLWDELIYDYLVGNTDNHIKNFSLLYAQDLHSIQLAPAYDIISTVIYDGSSMDMAIGIGGERNISNITREHFAKAADEAGLGKKLALSHLDTLCEHFQSALNDAVDELTKAGYIKANEIKEHILLKGGYHRLKSM